MPSSLFETVNRLGTTWAGVMAAVTVQAVALAALASFASRLLRRASPAVRHALWLIVAAKLLLMPLWTWSVTQPSFWASYQSPAPSSVAAEQGFALRVLRPTIFRGPQGEFRDSAAPVGPDSARFRIPSWPLSWPSCLMIIWVGGMVWKVARIARMRGELNEALRHAATLADPRWNDSLAALSAAIGLDRPPCLVTIEGGASPFVCGVIRPTLVLPRPLIATLAAERWRAVILHELAHLKRGDLIWAWVPELARIVLWFHPVSHWVARRAQLERELACDGLAMTMAEVDASGYAQTIVDVLTLSAPSPGLHPTAAAFGPPGSNDHA